MRVIVKYLSVIVHKQRRYVFENYAGGGEGRRRTLSYGRYAVSCRSAGLRVLRGSFKSNIAERRFGSHNRSGSKRFASHSQSFGSS